MLPSRRRSSRLSRESMKGGRRRSSSNKAMDDDEEVVWTSSSEEEPEEDFDLAEYQRLDRERKDAIGRRQRQLIEQCQREEEAKGKQTVEPSAAGSSTFPSATVDSGESVESFDLEEYRQKDIEKHTARQREARKRAESRNAKEKADKAKPAELSSDSDSDESDTEDTPEAKKTKKTAKKPPATKKPPAVPHERVESLFAKQMDKYKNDIPKELFTSSPKPPQPKKQPLPPQTVSTTRRSNLGTSDKENKSAEKPPEQQRLETETEVVTKKLSASATRSSTTNLTKQPNNPVVEQEQDEESDEIEIIETPTETVKAKVPLPSHILAGRETLSRDREVSPSQNQGSFLTSTPSQKTVGLSQGLSQSIALSPLPSAKEPNMRHLILTQKVHQKASRLPVRVQAPPARIEDEASQPPVPVQAQLPANQSQAVENQQKGRKSRASIAPQVRNGTFEVSHGFGGTVPRIQRTPHGNRVATAEEEEDNGEIIGVSEEGEDFPDEFPQTDSDGQNENEKGEGAPETSPEQVANSPTKPLRKSKVPPPPPEEVEDAPATNVQSSDNKDKTLPLPAKVTEEEKEVRTSKARTSFVRRLDRTFTAAEHAQGASTSSRQAIQNQQKKDETFPVGAAGPSTSPVIIDVPNEEDIVPPEKSPSPPKHAATRSRPSKKGKEAPVIKLPTRKSKRDKGPPSTAAVFEEEEAPASTAQPFERSPEDLFEDSDEDDGAQRPSTSRQTIQNQQKKVETFPVGAAAAGPSTSPVIIDVPNEEVAVERPAKRDTRSRASKKREGVPTVTLPIKKSKQGKAPPPPEPEVPPETRATRSGASKKREEAPAVKLPTKKSKAKAPPPPTVVEEQEEEEMEAPASSVRHQEKALPKEAPLPQPADDGERPSTSRQAIEKQKEKNKTTPAVADGEKEKEEMATAKLSRRTTRSQVGKQPEVPKGKSKQDKVPPPPEPEKDEVPSSSKVSKKRKAKAAIEVQSSKKAKKDRVSVPPPIPEEMEIEEGDIVSPQTTDVMAKAGPSTTSPPKSTKSKAGSARRRQRLESDSDEEEAAPAKPPKQVTRPKGKGATVVTSSAKTSKKAPPPVAVVSEEEEEDHEEPEVVATSSKAKSSTAGTQQKALSQPSEDDDQRPSTSRQAIEKQQKKNKSSTVVAGPSSSITSLSQRSNLSNHVSASRRPSFFQTLREARAGSVQPTTSAAATAVKKAKKKVRNHASTSNREETPERYVGNDVFGNYHMLQEEDFKQILNAEKPDHGLSAEEVQQMSLKVNHFLEDFFTFHCNETEHFYGFIPFLEMKQALIDQCLLEEDCTDEDFLVIMKQNFTKEAWKKGEGILYPSRYDMKHPPDTSDYLYK